MKTHLRSLRTAAAALVLLLPALLQAHVIFDGGTYFRAFGTTGLEGVLDNTTWSPNSTIEQSLRIPYTGTFQNLAFRGTSTAEQVIPASINWDNYSLQFDYMSTSMSRIYRMRLLILGTADVAVLDFIDHPSLTLVADGTWRTATIPVSDWLGTYYTAVDNNTFNPNEPQFFRISIQNHNPTGDLYVDNIMFVPEPSVWASLIGLGVMALVLLRRRQRT